MSPVQGGALSVLLTNLVLAARTGTELYVCDVAEQLVRSGHRPVVYSPRLGALADELRRAGIAVVDDLDAIAASIDVIHGHHLPATLAALVRFPGVPAVGFCHDRFAWHDAPICHPRVRRWVGVSEALRDRLVLRHGVPEVQAMTLPNAVDLDRFTQRGPLPDRPRKALVFSNYAAPGSFAESVAEACRRTGTQLDVVGSGVGRLSDRPEELLGGYDLVFAVGRSAIEALAVGCAVVVCGPRGLGGLVRSDRIEEWRRANFAPRAVGDRIDVDRLVEAIEGYDPLDAAKVGSHMRETAGLGRLVERLVELYREVIAEQAAAGAGSGFSDEERRAVVDGLAATACGVAEVEALYRDALEAAGADRAAVAADRDRLEHERPQISAERERLALELARMEGDRDRLAVELEAMRADRDRLLGEVARADAVPAARRGLLRSVVGRLRRR